MKSHSKNLLLIIAYTVAVYVATVALQIYQPATGGYFNLGEAMIYLAALTAGPLVASIAGGIGSSLADLSTGYGIFAPATLVIKFTEGYVAGYLAKRFKGLRGKAIGALTGACYTALLLSFSVFYWRGKIYVGPEQWLSFKLESPLIEIPLVVWIIIAFVLGALIAYSVAKNVYGGEAAAVLLSGLIMVTGYLLYEYFVSNPLTGRPPAAAFIEVPVNIGQAVIGAAIAIPLASWLRRAGYVASGGQGQSE